MTQVDFHPIAEVADERLKYAVIMAQEDGKWLLCRQKERSTWEIPGGRRESGESLEQAARRELYEETGATDAEITPVEVYSVTGEDGATSFGMLFLARVSSRGELPKQSEMREVKSVHLLPKDLTYPDIQPKLFSRVQYRLNINTNAKELWDVLDENRQLTGRTHPRGVPLPTGDYHLVVLVLLQNDQGDFLITRRAPQ